MLESSTGHGQVVPSDFPQGQFSHAIYIQETIAVSPIHHLSPAIKYRPETASAEDLVSLWPYGSNVWSLSTSYRSRSFIF